jgi:hypothetical protein
MRYSGFSFAVGKIELTLPDGEPPAAAVRSWKREDGQECIGIEFDGKLVLLECGYVPKPGDTDRVAETLRGWLSTARLVQGMEPEGKS